MIWSHLKKKIYSYYQKPKKEVGIKITEKVVNHQ